MALVAGAAYLIISGSEVPAQRSYVMTATVLVAVLLDRPALTMRSVALAALIVLAMAPESLMQPGFQMSFAATIALVAAFEALRGRAWWQHTQTAPGWRFAKPMVAIAMTSLVAGAATAPISAFHFNAVAQYGLMANLLAIPAMGMVVMPAAVIAVAAAPFGLDWLPFQVAGLGMGYIIAVARFVAGLGGAVTGVPSGPPASLGADPDRRGHRRALDRAGALGGAGAGGAGAGALGGERPAGRADRRQRAALRDRHAGGAGAVGRQGQRLCRRELVEGRRGSCAHRPRRMRGGTCSGASTGSWPRCRGSGKLVYVGSRDAGGASGLCAGSAILIAPNWSVTPDGGCLFVGQRTASERGGAGDPGYVRRAGGGGRAVAEPRPAVDPRRLGAGCSGNRGASPKRAGQPSHRAWAIARQ